MQTVIQMIIGFYLSAAIAGGIIHVIWRIADMYDDARSNDKIKPIKYIGPTIFKAIFWPIWLALWLFRPV